MLVGEFVDMLLFDLMFWVCEESEAPKPEAKLNGQSPELAEPAEKPRQAETNEKSAKSLDRKPAVPAAPAATVAPAAPIVPSVPKAAETAAAPKEKPSAIATWATF